MPSETDCGWDRWLRRQTPSGIHPYIHVHIHIICICAHRHRDRPLRAYTPEPRYICLTRVYRYDTHIHVTDDTHMHVISHTYSCDMTHIFMWYDNQMHARDARDARDASLECIWLSYHIHMCVISHAYVCHLSHVYEMHMIWQPDAFERCIAFERCERCESERCACEIHIWRPCIKYVYNIFDIQICMHLEIYIFDTRPSNMYLTCTSLGHIWYIWPSNMYASRDARAARARHVHVRYKAFKYVWHTCTCDIYKALKYVCP